MADNKNSAGAGDQVLRYDGSKFSRRDFPSDFIFGAATSAYQVEGGYSQGRKSLSNWDVFSIQWPGKISDGSNGCVAVDHYNLYKEDVALMKKLGLDAYRLSISWSRILPGGRLSAGINREGVKFYKDLIDLLVSEGIEPFVTIFHFDIPQCLEDEYGGFLDSRIVRDFAEYAEVYFFEFGDRVKFWITENEPVSFTLNGYVSGSFPPAHGSSEQPSETDYVRHRCVQGVDSTCAGGDPGTEPYIVAHNLILAHAAAVDIYRRNYQAVQGGKIGVTNMTAWYEPYTDSEQDVAAAKRALDFTWGWFVAPIVTGDYPPVIRERVGKRLPKFTPEEEKLVKGSYDFIGMNYYTTNLAAYAFAPPDIAPTYNTDLEAVFYHKYPDGTLIGPQAGSDWLYVVPYGIYKLLVNNMETYNNPLVYITENGVDEKNRKSLSVTLARKDHWRIKFYQDHLAYVRQAIDASVNVKGFILWALFDNYEWAAGYTVRFGLYYVDYVNGLIRYPKDSAIWYMNFLNKNPLPQLPSTKRQIVEEIAEAANNSVKRKRNR